jgi:hypothetical protein
MRSSFERRVAFLLRSGLIPFLAQTTGSNDYALENEQSSSVLSIHRHKKSDMVSK